MMKNFGRVEEKMTLSLPPPHGADGADFLLYEMLNSYFVVVSDCRLHCQRYPNEKKFLMLTTKRAPHRQFGIGIVFLYRGCCGVKQELLGRKSCRGFDEVGLEKHSDISDTQNTHDDDPNGEGAPDKLRIEDMVLVNYWPLCR